MNEHSPDSPPLFRVIDKTTGKEPDLEKIALEEGWAHCLVYCDMEGFAICEDGLLVLLDECGNMAYPPIPERFQVIWNPTLGPEEEKP
mgnify:CR=1 FL=1